MSTVLTCERIEPIVPVTDISTSIAWYRDVAGFSVLWEMEGAAGLALGNGQLMLIEGQGNPGTWIWIGVPDAIVAHEIIASRGGEIRHAPLNFPWALEFQVFDPDGNVLRYGSEPLDAPYDEWLPYTPKLV